jgi:RNA polymerase sigma-70 factor, ECF subfamily
MRRILVDHARGKQAEKRGGEDVKLELDEAMIVGRSKDVNLVALDEALSISPATVKRDWAMAKSWRHRELKSG